MIINHYPPPGRSSHGKHIEGYDAILLGVLTAGRAQV